VEQILLHLVGDYLIQNDWMAYNKKDYTLLGWVACITHSITYSIPFLLITNWKIVILICFSHFIIDKTKVITYLLRLRNRVHYSDNYGFGYWRPAHIAIWLNIITDNTFHLIGNYLLITYATGLIK